jgi:hypothetical protein
MDVRLSSDIRHMTAVPVDVTVNSKKKGKQAVEAYRIVRS